jgi:RNA-directed DNA polymerase
MPSFYSRLCKESHLHAAWREISKTNRQSHGFDEQTIKEFSDHLGENIAVLSHQLRTGTFEFEPARGVLAIKEGGKKRPIKVPAVRDRVVLSAFKLLISERFEAFNLDCSYGYVPGRNVRDAIDRIQDLNSAGRTWVLEADIKKFFDSVDQQLLIGMFVHKIKAPSLLSLLERAIRVEVGNLNCFEPFDQELFPAGDSGIPQGGVLSPLLANFYLNRFDEIMTERGFELVRYADDFVVMCKTRSEAKEAYDLSLEVLEGDLNLKMHHLEDQEGKTRITNYHDGFTFLGIEFDRGKVLPSQRVVSRLKAKITMLTEPHTGRPILGALISLRNTLRGWGQTFKDYDSELVFQDLDRFVEDSLTKLLRIHGFFQRDRTLGKSHMKILGIPSLVHFRSR